MTQGMAHGEVVGPEVELRPEAASSAIPDFDQGPGPDARIGRRGYAGLGDQPRASVGAARQDPGFRQTLGDHAVPDDYGGERTVVPIEENPKLPTEPDAIPRPQLPAVDPPRLPLRPVH